MKFLKRSNRYLHLSAGLIIYIVVFLLLFFAYPEAGVNPPSIAALLNVFITMGTVEYIQHRSGYRLDIIDVLAGITLPTIATVLIIIIA